MSFRRRIADRLLDHACAVMPPSRSDWTEAMRAEFANIPDEPEALAWACGCVWACYVERIDPMEVFLKSLVRAVAVWLLLMFTPFAVLAVMELMHPWLKDGIAGLLSQALRKLPEYYAGILVSLWGCELLIARFWSSPKKTFKKTLARAAAVWLWPFGIRVFQHAMLMTDPRLRHLMSDGLIVRRIMRGDVVWLPLIFIAIFIPLLICEMLIARYWSPRAKLPA